jgi:hypothetical protein
MLPVAAQAAPTDALNNEQVIALNKAQKLADRKASEAANRAARCALAAAGVSIPGKILLATCPGARALQTLPGVKPPQCPVVGREMTKVESNVLNGYLIQKAKAEALTKRERGDKVKLAPSPSEEVAALLACNA